MARMSFTNEEGNILIQVACDSIQQGFTHDCPLELILSQYPPTLLEVRASFVTLQVKKELRGCKGTVIAHQPLINDVAYNAYATAFTDSRFLPLQYKELSHLEIHISILSPLQTMEFTSETDVLRQLRPHIDGLLLQEGWQQSTFLPSVWEMLPDPQDFLRHLKQKAGLPMHHWSDSLKIQRYTTESIKSGFNLEKTRV